MNSGINSRLKVFIVDDDYEDREIFAEILQELTTDLDLSEFKNGKELIVALEECKNHCPDLVFLDLNMPVMDGTAALKTIRQREEFRNIPIIAIYSTSSAQKDQEETFKLGADIYVNKPNDIRTLKESLSEILMIDWKSRNRDMKNYVLKINQK